MFQSESVDSAWSNFKDIFFGILDKIVPEKNYKNKAAYRTVDVITNSGEDRNQRRFIHYVQAKP